MRTVGSNGEARWGPPGQVRGTGRLVRERRAHFAPTAWTGIAIALAALLLMSGLRVLIGGNPFAGPGPASPTHPTLTAAPVEGRVEANDDAGHASFVSFVLEDVQATWHEVFERHDLAYREANLVMYRGSVASPCGMAPAAHGPFYCQADGNVYLDLASYDRERERHGAAVALSETYALAREIGHHVQHLIGTLDDARLLPIARPTAASGYAAALELQAACFAGVWAASADARGVVAFDDDAVAPLSGAGEGTRWRIGADHAPVHDPSAQVAAEQRWAWFRTGLLSGDPAACDTFSGP
jgi:uncharacterized protein